MQSIFIGRQPILSAAGELHGYELLCRDGEGRLAIAGNGDRQSTLILLDTILSIGIERIAKSHSVFINVTETLLLSELIDTLPAKNVVLEVLETVRPSAALLARLKALRARKFTIALDDFVLDADRAPLLAQADIVKLDLMALPVEQLPHYVTEIRRHPCKLLAEKVETIEQFEHTKALGFDLFQGYYFARPELYTARTLRPNRIAVLHLLSRVNDPDITVPELATLIRNDVALSVSLLRWANAAGSGMVTRVESIERAIVALGVLTIQNWVGLIALARMGSRANELVTMVLVRARTCELLSRAARLQDPASHFTVGLFSALDVMMEAPMESLLEQLPLHESIKTALLHGTGTHGAALKAVIAMELGDSASMNFASLPLDAIGTAYVDAIEWADGFIRLNV